MVEAEGAEDTVGAGAEAVAVEAEDTEADTVEVAGEAGEAEEAADTAAATAATAIDSPHSRIHTSACSD